MRATLKSKKVAAGLYRVSVGDSALFEVERVFDFDGKNASWRISEVITREDGSESTNDLDQMQTKADALWLIGRWFGIEK